MVDEPEKSSLLISEEATADLLLVPLSVPVEKCFYQVFEGDEKFCFVSEEPPLVTLPMSLVAPASFFQDEVGPSNKGRMKQVTTEVHEGINLLRKPDRTVVWMKPMISPLERENLESHSSITFMNGVIHSTLKVYFPTFNSFISPFSYI